MEIKKVQATPLKIPVNFEDLGVDHKSFNNVTHVEVETDTGLLGYGLTSITQSRPVAEAINSVLGPAIIGMDPTLHERVWEKLYWTATPWAQSGYASHAISAIDLALWDIKGRDQNLPVWRLLGGAHTSIPIYATCGFSFMSNHEVVEVVKRVVEKGFTGVKLQVGRPGLDYKGKPPTLAQLIKDDIKRVTEIREAVGPDVEIAVDSACRLDYVSALKLCEGLEELNISFFEEPIVQNDVNLLAKLRQKTSIPLSAGQNEGLAYRFRDFLVSQAVDVIQPNVIITGGITQCLRIAGMASAFNVLISNGGGAPLHNGHFQAGVTNGTAVEYQYNAVAACDVLYGVKPVHENGCMVLSEDPGFGLQPKEEVIKYAADV